MYLTLMCIVFPAGKGTKLVPKEKCTVSSHKGRSSLAPFLSNCLFLGKLLHFFVPQFPHLLKGNLIFLQLLNSGIHKAPGFTKSPTLYVSATTTGLGVRNIYIDTTM